MVDRIVTYMGASFPFFSVSLLLFTDGWINFPATASLRIYCHYSYDYIISK